MDPLIRVTKPTLDVLSCLLDATEATWGLLIIKQSGRPAGTVYPILDRLERLGWVDSRWDDTAERPGPRRRLYRLTPDAAAAARSLLAAKTVRSAPRAARIGEAGA